MKIKVSWILLIAGCVASLGAFAKQQKDNKEDKAIKAIVSGLWFVSSEQDFRRIVSVPYVAISVRNKGNKLMAFRDKSDIEQYLKARREENERLAKEPPIGGGPIPIIPPEPQLSQINITKPNADVAYVSYNLTYNPNPSKKPPIPLIAVLRKEQNSWKLVFNAMP